MTAMVGFARFCAVLADASLFPCFDLEKFDDELDAFALFELEGLIVDNFGIDPIELQSRFGSVRTVRDSYKAYCMIVTEASLQHGTRR